MKQAGEHATREEGMDAITNTTAADMSGFRRDEHVVNGVKTVVYSIGSGPELVFLHGAGTFTGFAFAPRLGAAAQGHHSVQSEFR